jgi:hypothetical protein
MVWGRNSDLMSYRYGIDPSGSERALFHLVKCRYRRYYGDH